MSQVILQGEDVNMLIFKYLLEQGYTHTSFVFSKEAGVSSEKTVAKKISPYALTSLIEKGMVLRCLEQHSDLDETSQCTSPYMLFEEHKCEVTEKAFLGKREALRMSNLEIAREIRESLIRVDNETVEGPPLVEERVSLNLFKSKSLTGNPKPKKIVSEEVSSSQAKSQAKEPRQEKEPSKVAEEEVPQPAEVYSKVELKEVEIPYIPNNYELVETYYDGLSTNMLLKVKDGNISCFMVVQQHSENLQPLFILPTDYIQSPQHSTSLLLRKHLILVSEQGEMSFLNYNLRYLQTRITFSLKPPKAIIHSYHLFIYVVICEKKTYIVDDLKFGLKREIPGAFESAAVSMGGRIALIGENNQVLVIDNEDKEFSMTLNTGEVVVVYPVEN